MTDVKIITADAQSLRVPMSEAMGYMGVRSDVPEIKAIAEELLAELRDAAILKACFAELPLNFENGVRIGSIESRSEALRKSLAGCVDAVVFVATVGVGVDRLVSRYSKIAPSKAVILGGLGSAMIESFCDFVCGEIAKEYAKIGKCIKPRFSPGYGGFSLDVQIEIGRMLDTEKRIGLYFTDSLMMIPEKSVTAVMGIYERGMTNV